MSPPATNSVNRSANGTGPDEVPQLYPSCGRLIRPFSGMLSYPETPSCARPGLSFLLAESTVIATRYKHALSKTAETENVLRGGSFVTIVLARIRYRNGILLAFRPECLSPFGLGVYRTPAGKAASQARVPVLSGPAVGGHSPHGFMRGDREP